MEGFLSHPKEVSPVGTLGKPVNRMRSLSTPSRLNDDCKREEEKIEPIDDKKADLVEEASAGKVEVVKSEKDPSSSRRSPPRSAKQGSTINLFSSLFSKGKEEDKGEKEDKRLKSERESGGRGKRGKDEKKKGERKLNVGGGEGEEFLEVDELSAGAIEARERAKVTPFHSSPFLLSFLRFRGRVKNIAKFMLKSPLNFPRIFNEF